MLDLSLSLSLSLTHTFTIFHNPSSTGKKNNDYGQMIPFEFY
jgi:hypothetical protein